MLFAIVFQSVISLASCFRVSFGMGSRVWVVEAELGKDRTQCSSLVIVNIKLLKSSYSANVGSKFLGVGREFFHVPNLSTAGREKFPLVV